MEPYVVRWGAAIPIRPGHWRQLLDKTAHVHEPPGYDPSCTEYILRSYYMSLQRSNGVFGFSNLGDEDARIERSGEFLCIQSGGKCGVRPSLHLPPRRVGSRKFSGQLARSYSPNRLKTTIPLLRCLPFSRHISKTRSSMSRTKRGRSADSSLATAIWNTQQKSRIDGARSIVGLTHSCLNRKDERSAQRRQPKADPLANPRRRTALNPHLPLDNRCSVVGTRANSMAFQ